MLTKSCQSGSPHYGGVMVTHMLISFALTLFLVLVTAGNTLWPKQPAMVNLALFSLTPIFGWLELLNQDRTDGTLPIAWAEDQITTIQHFWEIWRWMNMFTLELAFKDTVLDNYVYLKIIQMPCYLKYLTALLQVNQML